MNILGTLYFIEMYFACNFSKKNAHILLELDYLKFQSKFDILIANLIFQYLKFHYGHLLDYFDQLYPKLFLKFLYFCKNHFELVFNYI
jgi:hypothetical protein